MVTGNSRQASACSGNADDAFGAERGSVVGKQDYDTDGGLEDGQGGADDDIGDLGSGKGAAEGVADGEELFGAGLGRERVGLSAGRDVL